MSTSPPTDCNCVQPQTWRLLMPALCWQVLTMAVASASADSYQAAAMDQIIVEYVNYVGACERIQRTPIPLPYTRHLSRCCLSI